MNKRDYTKLMKLPIPERNKEFQKLTRKEKRVLIAYDLLDQIKIEKFIPKRGSYYHIDFDKLITPSCSLQQELIPENRVECAGCGIAGLFHSYIRLANKVKLKDTGTIKSSNRAYFGPIDIEDLSNSIFPSDFLKKIEDAFEQWDLCEDNIDFEDPDERLITICKNIIKNKGDFKL